MGVHGGPDIITDGLKLCLDKYDNSSYLGEPTVNLCTPGFDTWNVDSSGYSSSGVRTLRNEDDGLRAGSSYSNEIAHIVDTSDNTRHHQYINGIGSSTTYTFSVYYRSLDGNAPTFRYQYTWYAGGSANGDGWAQTAAIGITDVSGWQRAVGTVTTPANTTRMIWWLQDGADYTGYTHIFELKRPQVEQNSHVTRFLNGTRSATDGWKDLSGNGNHADLTSLTYSTTNIRNTLNNDFSFDGSSDYVNLGTPSSVDLPIGNNSRTVGVWFKANSGGSGQDGLIGWGSSGGTGYAWGLLINSDDTIGIACYGDDVFAGSVRDDTWHYCVATHDSSTGNRVLYLDGVSIATDSSTLNTADASARVGDWIGSHKFHGPIDVVEVYNTALTSKEVLQNFDAKRSRFGV